MVARQAREAMTRMSRETDGDIRGAGGRPGGDRAAPEAAATPPTGSGPVFATSTEEEDEGGSSADNECSARAPGDRFQPQDLLSVASFHADNGAWEDCLDVLDTAQEVCRVIHSPVVVVGRGRDGYSFDGSVGVVVRGVGGELVLRLLSLLWLMLLLLCYSLSLRSQGVITVAIGSPASSSAESLRSQARSRSLAPVNVSHRRPSFSFFVHAYPRVSRQAKPRALCFLNILHPIRNL